MKINKNLKTRKYLIVFQKMNILVDIDSLN